MGFRLTRYQVWLKWRRCRNIKSFYAEKDRVRGFSRFWGSQLLVGKLLMLPRITAFATLVASLLASSLIEQVCLRNLKGATGRGK